MGLTVPARTYEAAMAVLLHWRETHTPATVRAVAKRMGLNVSTTAAHLASAMAAGLIEQHADRSYWPLQDCACPRCGALHVSEASA